MPLCQKSEVGLEIERSDTSSDRVYHAWVRKIRNAFELYNFIYSSLQKVKQDVIKVSHQTRKGHKTSDDNFIVVKFSDKISKIWSSMMLVKGEITKILALEDDNSCLVSANSETR